MASSNSSIRYGQVICGPPGSGKTTYCEGMQQYLQLLGRHAYVINLDPANEAIHKNHNDNNNNDDVTINDTSTTEKSSNNNTMLPYTAIYDVCIEAVNLTSVMEQLKLGPNGGLVYCMEYIEEHIDTIVKTIEERIHSTTIITTSSSTTNNSINSKEVQTEVQHRPYLLFDLPGQVELYTHSKCVQNIIQLLIIKLNLRLTAVQLIDSNYCTEPTKFISAALLGTTTMIRLELPIVNVLSKIDLLALYGDSTMPFQLDYFMICQDLDRLIPFLSTSSDHPETKYHDDNNDDDNDNDYTNDPEYQRIRQKRLQSSFYKKYTKLHRSIGEVVDDFGLLSFIPLDISDVESVGRVLAKIDKANGYVFIEALSNNASNLFHCAIQSDNVKQQFESISEIRERISNHQQNR